MREKRDHGIFHFFFLLVRLYILFIFAPPTEASLSSTVLGLAGRKVSFSCTIPITSQQIFGVRFGSHSFFLHGSAGA